MEQTARSRPILCQEKMGRIGELFERRRGVRDMHKKLKEASAMQKMRDTASRE